MVGPIETNTINIRSKKNPEPLKNMATVNNDSTLDHNNISEPGTVVSSPVHADSKQVDIIIKNQKVAPQIIPDTSPPDKEANRDTVEKRKSTENKIEYTEENGNLLVKIYNHQGKLINKIPPGYVSLTDSEIDLIA